MTTHAVHHSSLTVSSGVATLLSELTAAAAKSAGVNRAEVNVLGNTMRFTLEGTTPSATVGQAAPAGSMVVLDSLPLILGFKCIRESADVEVEVIWYAN